MHYDFVAVPKKVIYQETEDNLQKLEQEYGFCFPQVLREYYQQYNGSQIAPCRLRQGKEWFDVRRIIPLNGAYFSIEERMKQYKEDDSVPSYMVPLGDNNGDMDFFWDCRNEDVYRTYLDDTGFILICKGLDRFFEILNNAYWRDEDSPYDITEMTRRDLEMEKIEYLPLGSIVLLKEGVRKVLIIGRALNVKKGDKTYYFDYGGVLYPDGLTGDEMVYFNHDGVVRVYFYGYKDDDNDIMNENINNYVAEHPDLLRADPEKWNEE